MQIAMFSFNFNKLSNFWGNAFFVTDFSYKTRFFLKKKLYKIILFVAQFFNVHNFFVITFRNIIVMYTLNTLTNNLIMTLENKGCVYQEEGFIN